MRKWFWAKFQRTCENDFERNFSEHLKTILSEVFSEHAKMILSEVFSEHAKMILSEVFSEHAKMILSEVFSEHAKTILSEVFSEHAKMILSEVFSEHAKMILSEVFSEHAKMILSEVFSEHAKMILSEGFSEHAKMILSEVFSEHAKLTRSLTCKYFYLQLFSSATLHNWPQLILESLWSPVPPSSISINFAWPLSPFIPIQLTLTFPPPPFQRIRAIKWILLIELNEARRLTELHALHGHINWSCSNS